MGGEISGAVAEIGPAVGNITGSRRMPAGNTHNNISFIDLILTPYSQPIVYDSGALKRDIARASIAKHVAPRSGITEGPDFVGLAGQANPPLTNPAATGTGLAIVGEPPTARKNHAGLPAPSLRLDGYNPSAYCGMALLTT